MDNDKARNSLLYRLYHQYVKQDSSEIEQDKTAEIAVEQSGETFVPDSVPEETDTGSGAAVNAGNQIDECAYLEPLFNIQSLLFGEDKNQFLNIEEFEQYMFKEVRKHASYPLFSSCVKSFSNELVENAKPLLADILKRDKLKTGLIEPDLEDADDIAHLKQPLDATLYIKVSDDKMFAFICMFPPCSNGKEIDRTTVEKALLERGLTYGVCEAGIRALTEEHCYFQILMIGQGFLPVTGKDGKIIEHFQRTSEINIHQDEHGKADYRNLNSIQFIEKGQVICDIIPPEQGISGINLEGKEVPAKAGLSPVIPAGKNTILSEDGKQLLAVSKGQILFRHFKFDVTEVLVIKEDVDYSVGNLDYPGDIIIYGEVRTGFTVKSGGSVTIHGMVEAASIIAEGDVILKKGMNGNHNGQINSQGEVKASYLENCTVYSTGGIKANSVIACNLFCGDSVSVEGSIGAIIGGSVTALRSVKARMIGSKSRRETIITLGTAPHLLTERLSAEKEKREVADILDKLNKNVSYLEKNKSALSSDKLPVLEQLIQQQQLYRHRNQELSRKIAEFNSIKADYDQCRVQSNMIFPPTKISIGPYCYVFDTLASKCNVYVKESEIIVGTLA